MGGYKVVMEFASRAEAEAAVKTLRDCGARVVGGDGGEHGSLVPVAVALVYKVVDAPTPAGCRTVHILVGRRAEGMDYAGAWCLPGGKMEPDECLATLALRAHWANACSRELEEETGLRVRAREFKELCAFERHAVCGGAHRRIAVVAGVAQVASDAVLPRPYASEELDALEWWSLGECARRLDDLTSASVTVLDAFAQSGVLEQTRTPIAQCVLDALAHGAARAARRGG